MSSRFFTSRGVELKIAEEIGRGGEGSVFAMADKRLVAKIYHSPVDVAKAEKLRWMADNCSDQLLTTSAWVLETVHQSVGGRVVGLVMPRISAKEIHELYSPKSRRLYFPKADWRFLIRTAKNLAAAFNNIHVAGHVIGDVNQGNVVVQPDATVKLIDCDSYQITVNGRIFPCEVGVSTHIPPELQGVDLSRVVRTQNHDNFGLAVIIFQLLFLGRHPFAGNYIGTQDKSLDDSIREHRFAYGAGASSRQVKQPPGTLPLDCLNPETVTLFERSFLSDIGRPRPSDWIAPLESLFSGLIQCKSQASHHFYRTQTNCPWCEIEKINSWPVFPSSADFGHTQGFDLPTIESLLRSLQSIKAHAPLPVVGTNLPQPSGTISSIRSRIRNGFILTTVFQTIGSLLAVIAAGPARAFFGSLIVVGAAFTWAFRLSRGSQNMSYGSYKLKKQEWLSLEQSWRALGTKLGEMQAAIPHLNNLILEYKQLANTRLQRLGQLERDAYQHQLTNFLDRFRIDASGISGIGWKKLQLLQSFGVESAADVEQSRILRIPGFGPTYTNKLVNWRRGLESRFVFDRNTGVPKQEVQRVEYLCSIDRKKAETTLLAIASKLKAESAFYTQTKTRLTADAGRVATDLSQLQSDINATTAFTLSFAFLVALSFLIPFVSLIQRIASREMIEVPIQSTASAPATSNATPSSVSPPNTQSINANARAATNPNSSTLSDNEIAALTDLEKQTRAKELYDQGVLLTRANKFGEAEKVYREASRYDPSDVEILHELGYALYRLKRYNAAIEVLQKANKLDTSNSVPEIRRVLGLSYQSVQRWPEAAEIYRELSNEQPQNFEYLYQFGTSAKNAGDLMAAQVALTKAVSIKYSDPGVHYELADVYIKQGMTSEAANELEILNRLDPKLALRLSSRLSK